MRWFVFKDGGGTGCLLISDAYPLLCVQEVNDVRESMKMHVLVFTASVYQHELAILNDVIVVGIM